jgi:hypothetical protein
LTISAAAVVFLISSGGTIKEWFRSIISDKCYISIPHSQVVEELSSLNTNISQKASESTNIFVFEPTLSLCGLQDEYCQSHRDGNGLFSDEENNSILTGRLITEGICSLIHNICYRIKRAW